MKSIVYTCDNCNKQIPCGNRYFMINVMEMYNLHKETVSSKRTYHLCCDCFYTKREALGIEPDEIYIQ